MLSYLTVPPLPWGSLLSMPLQVEVWERLAPQLGIKNLVLLACSHRQLNMILIEDSIWQASLRACVDLTFDIALCPEEGLTWRYLAMQVVEGLGCLGRPGAEVQVAHARFPSHKLTHTMSLCRVRVPGAVCVMLT